MPGSQSRSPTGFGDHASFLLYRRARFVRAWRFGEIVRLKPDLLRDMPSMEFSFHQGRRGRGPLSVSAGRRGCV